MVVHGASAVRERVPRPVRHELHREALLHRLATEDCPLIVLVAPAGYGKTTLMAQYARQHGGRVVWLSLGDDDADPWMLALHLAQALQAVCPTLPLRHWQELSADTSAEGLAHALAADLTHSTTNIEFILDGTEVLQHTAERWLSQWLSALAEGHRVLLAGRSEPALHLARRVASGQARLFGVRDLAFSETETLTCLAGNAEAPAAVHARLEGWPVGVALVASGVSPHLSAADLIQGVLDQLPAPLRQVLPEASVLDNWTEEGPSVLGIGDLAPGWLAEVRRVGLPLIPFEDSYRPHQLVQEVLDTKLRKTPQRHRALHLQCGTRAEQEGDRLLALRHYVTAGTYGEAFRLAAALAHEYGARWEYRLVRQVLESLPQHLLPPDLQRLLGHALLETGEAVRGELILHRVRASGSVTPMLMFSLGLLAARSAQWTLQREHAEEGLRLAPAPKERGRLLRVLASAQLMLGLHQEASSTVQQALELARRHHDALELGATLTQQLQIYQVLNQREQIEPTIRQVLDLYRTLGLSSRMVWLQNDLASALVGQNRLDEALELIAVALPVAQAEQGVEQALLLTTWGDVLVRQGLFREATQKYQQAFELCRAFQTHLLAALIAPLLTEAALASGQVEAAQQVMDWVRPMTTVNPEQYTPTLNLCQGLWALHRNDWTVAQSHFKHFLATDTPTGTLFRVRTQLVEAYTACHLQTFAQQEAAVLEESWANVQVGQFIHSDFPKLQVVAATCQRAGWPHQALDSLLAQHGNRVNSLSDPALTLEIRTLGSLQVSLDGQPLHLPLSKSAEVLIWLALYGPASRDRLVDALWDGSNDRKHVEYFKVAVRHLRAALSEHPAVSFNPLPFADGVYCLSSRFALDIDVVRVKQALTSLAPEQLQQVLASYRGAFLPRAEASWAQQVRIESQEAAVAAALTLGANLETTRREEAAHLYLRAIELDPLREEGYLRLLQLYRSRDDLNAAQTVYRRYARMLSEEWGRQPNAEYAQVFERN